MRQYGGVSFGIETFERLCRERGLPLTVQRRAVLEALVRRRDHPTADQIFEDVSNRLPGVSRTTVYRVLDAFVKLGVARKVCHPDAAVRFEIESCRHHHLVCMECGKMVDLQDPRLDALPLPDGQALGFTLNDYSIQFRGKCLDCARAAAVPRVRRARKTRHQNNP